MDWWRIVHVLSMIWLGAGLGATYPLILKAWATKDLKYQMYCLVEAANNETRVLLPGAATAIGVGAGLALDIAQLYTRGAAAGGPTRTEVLITTTLTSHDRYLAGSADMYYIERADAVLYQPELPAPPPTPVKTWQVVRP